MTKNRVFAAALAASAAMAVAAPASAQVNGIATINTMEVITRSKAFTAAEAQLDTTFKPVRDQIQARQTKFQTDARTLITTIDTNKDGQVSEAEEQAAAARKDPNYTQLMTLQNQANEEIQKLQMPSILAELFAFEKILALYDAAQISVVNARKVNVILQPEAIVYAPDAVDISDTVVAELDKTPTVSITPPANWQPQQRTVQFQQQVNELKRRAYQLAAARAQQQQQQGAAAAPGAAAPAARPAAGATKPAKPEPR
nr:OmpH family outer membrane protein [uncultured Sphingomonas sp.]